MKRMIAGDFLPVLQESAQIVQRLLWSESLKARLGQRLPRPKHAQRKAARQQRGALSRLARMRYWVGTTPKRPAIRTSSARDMTCIFIITDRKSTRLNSSHLGISY